MREEFIQQYYEDVGHYPSEAIIQNYLGEAYDEEPRYTNQYNPYQSKTYHNKSSNPNDDLLEEIRDIVTSISSSARVAINNRVVESDQFKELNYMVYIFAAKTFLYFLFKNSISEGYDFRNM